MPRLPPSAATGLDADGQIVSTAFDDCYFSRHDGLGETRAVFLGGTGLPQAWAGRQRFVIGEIGFGTGLNVLATWDLWRKTRPQGAVLHIISVEGFLLDAETAGQAHQAWPELAPLSDALRKRWPRRVYGPQRICFEEDGLCLTLLIGPCAQVLAEMDFQADAWFLDGFSPAKNPDMWSQDVFDQVARLSASGARLGTYSVAACVRDGLTRAGFNVEKAQGFGHKRHRLEGVFVGEGRSMDAPKPKTALILGGGIAGAALVAAFTRRGVETIMCDDDPCGRTKASHNPIAILMPRLDRGDTREARFFRAAYVMACDQYGSMAADAFDPCGVLECEKDSQKPGRLADLANDPPLPPDMLLEIRKKRFCTFATAGQTQMDFILPRDSGGGGREALGGGLCDKEHPLSRLRRQLPRGTGEQKNPDAATSPAEAGEDEVYPPLPPDMLDVADGQALLHLTGGVVFPDAARNALTKSAVRHPVTIAKLLRQDGHWCAFDGDGKEIARAEIAIIAAGYQSRDWFDLTRNLGAKLGQISLAEAEGLELALSGGSYCAPFGDKIVFGATYEAFAPDAPIPPASADGHSHNLAALHRLAPDIAARIDVNHLFGRTSVRATTPDHLPIAGLLSDTPDQEGLYVLSGLGSRGFATAFLCAEVIASHACQEPSPVTRDIERALAPNRFKARAARA